MHNSSYLIRERDSVRPLKPSFSLHAPLSPSCPLNLPSAPLPLRSPLASPPVRVWCGLCKAGACLSEIPLLSATLTHTVGGQATAPVRSSSGWARGGGGAAPDCFSRLSRSSSFSFSFPFSRAQYQLGVGPCELGVDRLLSAWALPPPSSPLTLAPPSRLDRFQN